jgi:hypothetical protein
MLFRPFIAAPRLDHPVIVAAWVVMKSLTRANRSSAVMLNPEATVSLLCGREHDDEPTPHSLSNSSLLMGARCDSRYFAAANGIRCYQVV